MAVVTGPDNTIAMVGEASCSLTMRRKLQQRVDYLCRDLTGVRRRDSYGEVRVDVSACHVDADVLAAMFAAR